MPSEQPKTVSGWKSVDKVPPNIDPSVGDWRCDNCGNWNWARRDSCNKCGAAKPATAKPAKQRGTKRSFGEPDLLSPSQSGLFGASVPAPLSKFDLPPQAGILALAPPARPVPTVSLVRPVSQVSQAILEVCEELKLIEAGEVALAKQQQQLASRKVVLARQLQELQEQENSPMPAPVLQPPLAPVAQMQQLPTMLSLPPVTQPLPAQPLLSLQQVPQPVSALLPVQQMMQPVQTMPLAGAPVPTTNELLLDTWVQAKRNKDYKEADRIRDQLRQQGIEPTMPSEQPKTVSGWKSVDKVPPNIDPSVGDWRCDNCGNWNWARRDGCNKCGAAKPPQ